MTNSDYKNTLYPIFMTQSNSCLNFFFNNYWDLDVQYLYLSGCELLFKMCEPFTTTLINFNNQSIIKN